MLRRVFGFFLGLLLAMTGRPRRRPWRPAFPVHAERPSGQLSAGTIYRLLRDREAV